DHFPRLMLNTSHPLLKMRSTGALDGSAVFRRAIIVHEAAQLFAVYRVFSVMGGPRKVRSPSEEQEWQAHRAEESKRRSAAARARRKAQDPDYHAREAARMHRRRQDLRVREMEAERSAVARAQLREQDPDYHAREAARTRQRRQDPQVREKEARRKRQRRAVDAELRKRETDAKRRRRRELRDAANFAAAATAEFRRAFLDNPFR
ncbi:hypothetical protein ISCGN_019963, partial [Ixodes scapularis]